MTKEVGNLHFHANQDLNAIAKTLNTTLKNVSDHEVSIQPDKPEVKGTAYGMVLEPGIHLTFLKFNVRKPLQFNFYPRSLPVIRLIFCLQGSALYQFDEGSLDYELNKMLSATMANSMKLKHQLSLTPRNENQLLWIYLDEEAFKHSYRIATKNT